MEKQQLSAELIIQLVQSVDYNRCLHQAVTLDNDIWWGGVVRAWKGERNLLLCLVDCFVFFMIFCQSVRYSAEQDERRVCWVLCGDFYTQNRSMVEKSWIALVCTMDKKRDDAGFFIGLFSYITVSFSQKARFFFLLTDIFNV